MKALILLSIVVIALAAPARAWCEAACTQPAADQQSHCPAHTHSSGTSIAAADQDQCRAIDAARTQSPARLSSLATAAFSPVAPFAPFAPSAPTALSAPYAPYAPYAPSFSLPLRI